MTTLVSLLGIVGRAIGKVLTSSLGWASSLLYGKVPADHRKFLDVMMGASLVWALLAVAALIPAVGSFLRSSTPFATSIGLALLRSLILAGLILLPAVVGLAGCFVPAKGQRPKGGAIVGQILRGYPLTVLIVGLALLLPAIGIARKIGNARRGWSDAHIPIVVKPGGYGRLVEDMRAALAEDRLETEIHPAPRIFAVPGKLLQLIAARDVEGLVPDQLVGLRRTDLEVGVFPSDIAVRGTTPRRIQARSVLLTRLATSAAHLTTSAESQRLEDRIQVVASSGGSTNETTARLDEIDEALLDLDVPPEDWDVLLRLRLQAERDVLRRQVGGRR